VFASVPKLFREGYDIGRNYVVEANDESGRVDVANNRLVVRVRSKLDIILEMKLI